MKTKRRQPLPSPLNWRPSSSEDIIGPARAIARVQIKKAERLRIMCDASCKLLFYGPPGIGKSAVANLVAPALTGTPHTIELLNGKEITVDVVRTWMPALAYGTLFSDWSVKIIDELDRCSRDAQDILLTYLDRLPAGKALIGTSNLELSLLTERLQTRFQSIKLTNPTTEELCELLTRWPVPWEVATRIAVGSGGCVRAALADLETWLDVRAAK
jgi:replication-associated recombination protein RarA